MISKDQKLDQLLKNLEVDKPSSDFTNDIMEMISSESPMQASNISQNIVAAEQAPKHMTDLVMESIIPAQPKTFEILSTKEKRNLILVLLAAIIITGLASIISPFSLALDLESQTKAIELFFTSPQSSAILFLIAGTGLWTIDQYIRSRMQKNY